VLKKGPDVSNRECKGEDHTSSNDTESKRDIETEALEQCRKDQIGTMYGMDVDTM
jgi:hypothetical protein